MQRHPAIAKHFEAQPAGCVGDLRLRGDKQANSAIPIG